MKDFKFEKNNFYEIMFNISEIVYHINFIKYDDGFLYYKDYEFINMEYYSYENNDIVSINLQYLKYIKKVDIKHIVDYFPDNHKEKINYYRKQKINFLLGF